jgi:DNA repair protein RecN (Recombination protein N)
MIRTGADSAEVEALFRIDPDSSVARHMENHALAEAKELVIRRIISRSNRHRVYVNGRLATIQLLKALGQNMVSISGQHAHQGLLKEDQQLMILDQIGGLTAFRKDLYDVFHRLSPLVQQYRKLIDSKDRQQDQLDLLRFQRQEIQAADIRPGEDRELEQESARLKNAAMLFEIVHQAIESLYDASKAVVERIMEVAKQLNHASNIDRDLERPAADLSENAYRIEDVVAYLRSYLGQIQVDEGRLETLEERLDLLNKLKRKYGGSLEAVIDKKAVIDKELSQVENISEKISELSSSLQTLQAKTGTLSEKLSTRRRAAAQNLSRLVEAELATLKMNQTRFEVALMPVASNPTQDPFLYFGERVMTETGLETARFLIAPNIGEAMKPMSEIVSGGELSRIVLALKAILAETDVVGTVIFDEVDAGIGGTVAEVVGRKLAKLARFHQVICITHLPQIARFGNHQFKIVKEIASGRTTTSIHPLTHEERIQEIARMLAGEKVTRKTLAHASEIMSRTT